MISLEVRQQHSRLSPDEIDAILSKFQNSSRSSFILKNSEKASQRVNPRRVIELDGSFVEDESFEVIDGDSDSENGDSIAILSGSSFEEEPEESETKTETTTETETE